MNSKKTREKLSEIQYDKIKSMCNKVGGTKALIGGKTVGHSQAFWGCSMIKSIDRDLKRIGELEHQVNRSDDIIRNRKKEFNENVKIFRESKKKSMKEIKKSEKDINEDMKFVERAKRPLEMILKGEL